MNASTANAPAAPGGANGVGFDAIVLAQATAAPGEAAAPGAGEPGTPVDPATVTEGALLEEGATTTTTTTSQTVAPHELTVVQMLNEGWYASYPLAICSVLVVAAAIDRFLRYRGLEKRSRELTRNVVEALAKRDNATAVALCTTSKTPLGEIFKEGLAWRNIALEDLERILATARQEAVAELRRGLWLLGTIGSLAPFVGLFGTVIGIMKAFHQIAIQGSGGFAVVAAGISEALIATAVGLGVAIVALAFYNYLQVRVGNIGNAWARATERLVQALLYVESAAAVQPPAPRAEEPGRGHPLPA